MKLADVHLVSNLNRQRDHLRVLRRDGKLTGELSTGYAIDKLDPIMVQLIRPLVDAELDQRIAVIEGDLRDLGVIVEAD